MTGNVVKFFLSFILSIVLFVLEVLLLVQFNVSRGITKSEINNIIDDVSIENEIIDSDIYKELEDQIDYELLQEIVESDELDSYLKGNAKAIYNNILYNENNSYISSDGFKEYVHNLIEHKKEDISSDDIDIIESKINELTKEIDLQIENIETYRSDIVLISSFMLEKTTIYLALFSILVAFIIIVINRSKDGYMFVGLTTIIVGVIFFVLWLSLSRTINTTGIDREVIHYVNIYLPTLLKTLKKSSIILFVIGALGCTIYTILHYQEVQQNGNM